MSEIQKSKKVSRGIVARRKPKKNQDRIKCPSKEESKYCRFGLSLPKDLYVLVSAAAASKNQRIGVFVANALRAELNVPRVEATPPSPKLNSLKVFMESMSKFDWTTALNEEEQEKKSHGSNEND